MNNIVFTASLVKFILFADGTNIFYSSSDINLLFETVRRDLQSIQEWILLNKLTINNDKTNYISFIIVEVCGERVMHQN